MVISASIRSCHNNNPLLHKCKSSLSFMTYEIKVKGLGIYKYQVFIDGAVIR